MSSVSPLNPLTERQQNICSYGGTFGLLLSLTCLIQHFVVAKSTWVTHIMASLYFFAMLVFLLLALQKKVAPVLLIISTVFSLGIQYIWMKEYAFSLAVLFLFLYHVVIIVMLFTEQIPRQLIQKSKIEKQEQDQWAGKI